MTRSSTPCSSISVAGVVVEDAAVGDDEHAVGEAEHLLDLARHHDDRGAGVGEAADEGVDLGAGADVDAAGRLVEQQHPGAVHEPAGEHDLLLVAAGEGAGGAVGVGRPQLEGLDLLAGHRALAALVEHAAAREAGEGRERDVLEDRLLEEQALALALLGREPDAGGRPPCRRSRRGAACRSTRDGAGGRPARAVDRLEDLGATGADEARRARRPRRRAPRT